MKTLTLNLPDNIDFTNNDFAMLVASKLYEQGKLSIGEAADVAGLSKRAFIELLASYEVSIFNSPVSELTTDILNA
ncbi:MAG: hypothetical protein CFE21_16850 [Bacteroidetes bacterium B1(2017)]|nr:MAG: hypothetical protein CFE21_16850 [Bacteroidetes bacterium B1(2017)]